MQILSQHWTSKRSQVLKTVMVWMLVLFGLTACTAHYPINESVTSTDAVERYSLQREAGTVSSEELLFILTFSGGGTRAAALSYGVLRTLADTQVVVEGKSRRLIDEVDAISSVSGGSFTAAYYGLFGDRIFEDFEEKFLKHDVQSELTRRVLSPLSWPKLGSLYYDRSDLAADYYDQLLFENKTFQDILISKGPKIAINATNLALGAQFSFLGSQFAPICTDLLSYPVSRAATASSAVPGAFTSVILKNYAGTCDYQMPEWATKALRKRRVNTRRYNHAKLLSDYLNTEEQPYIHLFDGGISDNLGIRPLINLTFVEGGIWNTLKDLNLETTRKLVVIVVNAQKEVDTSFTKRDYSVPLLDTLGAASAAPLNQYSFETMELLRNNMSRWKAAITAGRCREAASRKSETGKNTSGATPGCAAQTYLIEVAFEMLQDESEREHLQHLVTSFHLEPNDVDRLIAAVRQILQNSNSFQALLKDLQ